MTTFFGGHRYLMLFLYYRNRPSYHLPETTETNLPSVTVQLPLYNELCVVERLLESMRQLDYPRDLLQVQVLDDSTDNTHELSAAICQKLRDDGLNVEYIHRTNREGYKAGALENGLSTATGELVAIFDADFVPPADFLKRVVGKFDDPKVGLVQMRWAHLNRDHSLLTKLQSIMLDGHFIIEHQARYSSGRFFNFNGTAGVWRKATIVDAGGWQHDTLTEDLDLSYRAQLKGWRFEYVPAMAIPSELPADVNAFKIQQYRWTKGAIQTAMKLLPTVLRAPIPLRVKSEAMVHLTSNFAYVLMVLMAVMMLPVMLMRESLEFTLPFWVDLLLFTLTTISVACFYGCAQAEVTPSWSKQIMLVPLMMSLGIGLCIINAKGVIEALMGKQSEFTRTPKTGEVTAMPMKSVAKSYRTPLSATTIIELSLAAYYAVIAVYCTATGNFITLPFVMLFLFGFGYIALLSVLDGMGTKSPTPAPAS